MSLRKLLCCSLLPLSPLFANPELAAPLPSSVLMGEANGQMHLITTGNPTIEWKSFSINPTETVRFHQPSNANYVINQVTGGSESQLLGKLISNGGVYLLNPNGIYIGPGAQIDVAHFVGSTFDLFNQVDGSKLFQGSSSASIVNLGKIAAHDGDIFLFARQVKNEGSLEAKTGTVGVAATTELLLKPEGKERIFIAVKSDKEEKGIALENSGEINALKTELKASHNLYELAIKHSGKIDATSIEEKDGEIYLVSKGGRIENSGTITAPHGHVELLGKDVLLIESSSIDISSNKGGGTLLVGGDQKDQRPDIERAKVVYMSKNSTIKADGLDKSSGGKVVLWGDDAAIFYGAISAKGGAKGGDGGFIELSSPTFVVVEGKSDTLAPKGKAGTFFIDPTDITISSATTSSNVQFLQQYPNYILSGFDNTTANINTANLTTYLNSGNVTISSYSNGTMAGNITIVDPITWQPASGHTSLTLTSPATIFVNNNIAPTAPANPNDLVLQLSAPNIVIGKAAQTSPVSIIGQGKFVFDYPADTPATVAKSLTIQGGDSANASSEIFASGDLSIKTGDLSLLSGTLSPALITSEGTIDLTIAGSMLIQGSTGAASAASLKALLNTATPLNCTVGKDLTISSGTITLQQNAGKTLNLAVAGDLKLIGSSTEATILADVANINVTGDTALIGGPSPGSNATISTRLAGGTLLFGGNNLTLTAGAGGQALIHDSGSGSITIDLTADCNVTSSSTQSAIIETTNGTLNLTSQDCNLTTGGAPAYIRTTGSGSAAVAAKTINLATTPTAVASGEAVISSGGSLLVKADQDLSITGGALGAQAYLESAGPLTLITGGNCTLTQGVAADADARIITTGTDALTASIAGDLTLSGGSSANPGQCSILASGAGDLIASIGGNLSLSTDLGLNSTAEILTTSGNLTLNVSGNISLVANGPSGNAGITSLSGNIEVTTNGALFLNALGANSNAQIIGTGASPITVLTAGPDTFSAAGANSNARVFANSGPIVYKTAAALLIDSGSAGGSTAGLQTDGSTLTAILPSRCKLTGDAGTAWLYGSGDTVVTAGSLLLEGGNAQLEVTSTSGKLTINAQGTIKLSTQGAPGSSRLSGNTGLVATGHSSLLLHNNSVIAASSGDLDLIFDKTILMDGSSSVSLNGAGRVRVVVDNGSPSHIGGASFIMLDPATITTAGGSVQLFTGGRPLNFITSTSINGSAVVFDPEYNNTPQEQWNSFFPSPFFGGPGYTLFYKSPPLTEIFGQEAKLASQFFYNNHLFRKNADELRSYEILYKKLSNRSAGKRIISTFDTL